MLGSIVKKIGWASTLFRGGGNLLESPSTKVAHIEFTSRCNIRCVYCPVSRPHYLDADIDEFTLEKVIAALKKRGVYTVCVNGHGETTIYKDWHRYCDRMLDEGMLLSITSNFSRTFSPGEIDTLSRFISINISCDTSDPVLFKKLRRGNDLRTLCMNISRVLTVSAKKWRPQPILAFNCVVSDQNIFHLRDFAAFGIDLGITHFNFCNLVKYPDITNALNPNHITELAPELLPKARESLLETFKFLRDSGSKYEAEQGLLDSLEHKIRHLNDPVVPIPPIPPNPPETVTDTTRRYSSPRTEGQTRDCVEPWKFVMISANSDVFPCCGHPAIYTLGKNQSLLEVFNNIPVMNLRRQLLTGDLTPACMSCTRMGWTTTQDLQKRVRQYLDPFKKFYLFRNPVVKAKTFDECEITYTSGWYDLETDLAIKDPEKRQWRWTAKQAVCTFTNPGKDVVFMLRGAYPLTVLGDPLVTLKINSSELDEFRFREAKIYIEYTIPAERLGKEKEICLEISTDRTFVPSEKDTQSSDNRELGIQVFSVLVGIRKDN